jgi:hypothetical protein
MRTIGFLAMTVALCGTMACDDTTGPDRQPLDPDTAPTVAIDRFSDAAGMLFKRSANSALPAADAPIDMDSGPFITQGLGPSGNVVRYYNFDVQSTTPAPIFVLFREGESSPVDGQLNIVDDIPGDADYNDFWQVVKVTVPSDYVANTVTSLDEIVSGAYAMETTNMLVNCPIVPEGSTATMRLNGEDTGLSRGWYRSQVVFYFNFSEATITADASGMVPFEGIFVSFNINPDQDGGGPASGFMAESGTSQTHNVVESVPGDDDYSPLWSVNVYDNAAFNTVSDLASAMAAPLLGAGVAIVNCPIVMVGT